MTDLFVRSYPRNRIGEQLFKGARSLFVRSIPKGLEARTVMRWTQPIVCWTSSLSMRNALGYRVAALRSDGFSKPNHSTTSHKSVMVVSG